MTFEEIRLLIEEVEVSEHQTPTNYYPFLCGLVFRLQPKAILELGTGTGKSSWWMMRALPKNSSLTTINWPNPPSGDDVGCELSEFADDHRLRQILGDTREVRFWLKDDQFDFLFIDSGTTHEYALISEEWRLYESALADRAVVCVDDINANDMRRFWNPLPYEKVETDLHGEAGFGIFQYVRYHDKGDHNFYDLGLRDS
jgi:predicted O-methyltransferase YrrM